MNKKIVSILTIVSAVFFSADLFAETVYSLQDLCKIANKSALEIKISEDDLKISELEKRRALSVLVPRITAFGSKKRAYTDYEDQVPTYSMDGTTDTESYGVQLDQSFTLNGKELIAYKVTKDQISQSEYNLESVKSNYMFDIARAYYQVLSANKNLDISKADVKRLEKHRNSVDEKLKVGTVTKTALYRAEAELSKARTNALSAENNVKFSKAALKNLVDIDDNFSLIEDSSFNFDTIEISYETLIEKAIENRPEIKSVEKVCEIADKTVSYERGSYWPKLSIKGSYGDSEIVTDDYDSQYSIYESETDVVEKSIEANLSFTLFDGGLRGAQVKQALAKKRQADARLIDTKKKIILESKKAWFDYETAKSSLKTLNDELKSANENYNAVSMQFEYGLSDSVDMMDADTLLVSAQRRLTEGEYTYRLSVLELIRVKGELLELLL